MKKERYYCDICKDEIDKNKAGNKIPVIMTTEDTEGRVVNPYLIMENVDICDNCYQIILDGNLPFGQGAQGYNEYWFKN